MLRTELLSRFVSIGDDVALVEYKDGKWCHDVLEVDGSMENGYLGIKVHALINDVDLPGKGMQDFPRILESHRPGFQLGTGFIHYISVLSERVRVSDLSRLYSVDDRDISGWGFDIYQGLAGSLLTASLLLEFESSPKLEEFRALVYESLLSRIRENVINGGVGFAHGDLGIAYSLLSKKEICHFSVNYVERVLLSAEHILRNSLNYAICSGAISYLVVSAVFNKLRGASSLKLKEDRLLALKILEDVASNIDGMPLHLCCGLIGVVETVACYAEIANEDRVLSRLKNVVDLIAPSSFEKMNETGILFGVAGVDYVVSRLGRSEFSRSSFFYPFKGWFFENC